MDIQDIQETMVKDVVSHPGESSSHCWMQVLPAAVGCVLGKKGAGRAWLLVSEENQEAGPGTGLRACSLWFS